MQFLQPRTAAVHLAVAIVLIAAAAARVTPAAEPARLVAESARNGPERAASDPFAGLEFGGYVRMGEERQVYLFRAGARSGQWIAVGSASDGLWVEAFDAERAAVQVRMGHHSRWLTLRRATILASPVVLRPEGGIDWDHMRLSDREKEMKAAMQMWDLMEISRQARRDEP